MNRATVSQWAELYEITLDVKELLPWKFLTESDLISVESRFLGETCYFSFMQKDESSFGISCFIGDKGLLGFFDIVKNGNETADELLFEQRSLVAYFGAVGNMSPEDAALINDINMYFENDGDWLYFRSFEPGYAPWPLSREEVLALTDLYKQLYFALKFAFEDKSVIGNGHVVKRFFNTETEQWETRSEIFRHPKAQYETAIIEDEILLARVLKRPIVDARLELDVFYVMVPVDDDDFDKPFYPAMAMLADSTSGAILEFEMFTPEDSETDHILALIFGFVEKHGRPLIIYLQNERVRAMLDHLCRAVMIPVELVNFLPSINAFKLEKGITPIASGGEPEKA